MNNVRVLYKNLNIPSFVLPFITLLHVKSLLSVVARHSCPSFALPSVLTSVSLLSVQLLKSCNLIVVEGPSDWHKFLSVGARIAQWYSAGLWAGWSGVPIPAGAGNFSVHHCAQTGSGDHPASYPMGSRGSFPASKTAGA
jgi:hypothetical protein